VSVVVATYNRRDRLGRVISPLLGDPATTEVVVVVDGCADGSYELVCSMAAEDSRVVPVFQENSGAARAQQNGVLRASGDVVLILDDDVIAGPRLVSGHAHHHAERTGIVVVGYMPIRDWRSRGPDAFASYLYAQEYEKACVRYEERPSDVLLGLWGGNVSLRRADCLQVPVAHSDFPERYHMDREFGIRCMKAGLVGVFDRELVGEHVHARSLEAFINDGRHQGAGRMILHRLHGDVLGPPDVERFSRGLPMPVRWLVRGTRRPRARAIARSALRRLVAHTAAPLLFPVQLRSAQLLRRVELQSGALSVTTAADRPSVRGRSLAHRL
jgi:glycosyltransferase involved in cell wall biosynthesis